MPPRTQKKIEQKSQRPDLEPQVSEVKPETGDKSEAGPKFTETRPKVTSPIIEGPAVVKAEDADPLKRVDAEGLPVFIKFEDKLMETAHFIEQCKANKTPDWPDGFVASINPEKNHDIEGPIGAPVFVGHPYVNAMTCAHEIINNATREVMRLLYRDVKGPNATNCAVFLRTGEVRARE